MKIGAQDISLRERLVHEKNLVFQQFKVEKTFFSVFLFLGDNFLKFSKNHSHY